jgi:ribosome maturation factor RimP
MIERNRIEELIDQKLEGTELFLVELKINIANKIDVFIDGMKGVTIKDCVGISRHIESSLDREEQDFELNVSSPGAEESFKVLKQYEKNIGRKLIVSTNDGITQEGILIEANFLEIKIEKTEKRKKENGKGNILVKEIITLELAKVKQARVILSFK